MIPEPLRFPFTGRLSEEEQRMIDEGALDDYEFPEWLYEHLIHMEAA